MIAALVAIIAISSTMVIAITSKFLDFEIPRKPALISCTEMSYADRLEKQELKRRAGSDVGGMGMYQYKLTHKTLGKPYVEFVHPNIALWTPHGMLFGADRGEFGGELVFQSGPMSSEKYTYLSQANIEDLFVMPYGIVATTGYFHLGYDFGAVLLVTFNAQGTPSVQKIFELPGGVLSSWVTTDNELLVNTHTGSFLLKDKSHLLPVRCKQHWWQIF